MTIEADIATGRALYAFQTRERMAGTIRQLVALREGAGTDPGNILRGLRKQEEASRLAGFTGISRLCREMDGYLTETCRHQQPRMPAVVDTLADICRSIQLHADAVVEGLANLTNEKRPSSGWRQLPGGRAGKPEIEVIV